jgi:hypothetical protein
MQKIGEIQTIKHAFLFEFRCFYVCIPQILSKIREIQRIQRNPCILLFGFRRFYRDVKNVNFNFQSINASSVNFGKATNWIYWVCVN